MTARIVDKEIKRERILRAAMEVFSRKSLHDFRMIEVAEQAGVGKGTLYEYFRSKDELVVGCFGLFIRDFDAHLQSCIADIDDPVERIEAYISSCFDFFKREHARLEVLMDFWSASVAPRGGEPMLPGVAGKYQQAIEHLAAIVRDGIVRGAFREVDARSTAALLLALVDGLMFQSMLGLVGLHQPDLASQISDTFLEGIKV